MLKAQLANDIFRYSQARKDFSEDRVYHFSPPYSHTPKHVDGCLESTNTEIQIEFPEKKDQSYGRSRVPLQKTMTLL
jgi:hypothetical protein